MFQVVENGIYSCELSQNIKELNADGYILRHNQTGARVVLIQNEDKNKVFNIGFRTPPKDDTGVAHIIEHSVLCGSKKFPAKDPFVELVKGSLNTFLNAMTYSDKTVYPIASCNDKDYHNLMHVYLDAVFYPNIYKEKKILMQEGWHYECEDKEEDICYNGVVYNEMKGVFSSGDELLARLIQQSLLPDTPYGFESGGDPVAIPDLTYEEFLNFHKTYYHPSNSYIYLYGNVDFDQELQFIHDEYLSHFEKEEIDSSIAEQEAFETPVYKEDFYSISDGEQEEDNTYLSYNVVVKDSLDKELYLSFQILDYVLFGMPGAPLKKAILDKKIGKDVYSSYDNGIKQPTFSVVVKASNEDKQQLFIETLEQEAAKIVENGMDQKTILAAINHFEFKYKEANFGRYPKGLIYGLQMFDSWLYDDLAPFIHVQTEETFAGIKSKMQDGYFESLIQTYILDNPHKSFVMVKPQKGLTAKIEQETKDICEKYKASLTEEEIDTIIKETKELKEYQEEPSPKEILEMIPLLSIEDIEKKADPLVYEVVEKNGVKMIWNPLFTNGIHYLRLAFHMETLPKELIPYATLLSSVYRLVDTKRYTYEQLSTEINLKTGGMGTDIEYLPTTKEQGNVRSMFLLHTKYLGEYQKDTFELAKELLFTSKIDDTKRLQEIISQIKTQLAMRMNSQGHVLAANRALSYVSPYSKIKEEAEGIDFYEFILDLEKNFDEKAEEITKKLEKTRQMIFTKENFVINYTNEAFDDSMWDCVDSFMEAFYEQQVQKESEKTEETEALEKKNEAFLTSSKVQYVATAGNYIEQGFSYSGAFKVLQVMFSYDYLWKEVRVKGGAYGVMCGFNRYGNFYFTSYRDPELSKTYETFQNASEYVKQFDCDDRDMTKYIIGAISNMDIPMEADQKGAMAFRAYLMGVTNEQLQKEREEVLCVDQQTIRDLAPLIQSVTDANTICVIGNENKCEEEKEYFKTLRSLN